MRFDKHFRLTFPWCLLLFAGCCSSNEADLTKAKAEVEALPAELKETKDKLESVLAERYEPTWGKKDAKYPTYHIPGRQDRTTAFFHWDDLLKTSKKQRNEKYPPWYADEKEGKYYYQVLAGPDVKTGVPTKGITFGFLEQKADSIAASHNHPAAEIYYVIDGTAMWYVDDQSQQVRPGSIIFHRPYAVHGWRTDGKPLRALWVWWDERESVPPAFNWGSRLTNPDRDWDSEKDAKPQADPLPKVRDSR